MNINIEVWDRDGYKVYIRFEGETITCLLKLSLSDLRVLEEIIESVKLLRLEEANKSLKWLKL